MNRKILFRGKNRYCKEWLYGSLSQYKDGSFGIDGVPVETDSVGQFVGLTDKNGKEIYEGDIILYGNTIKNVVVFRHGAFGYLLYGGEFISYAGNTNFTFNPLDRSTEHEVIGNIFETPDLLNGK